MEKLEYNNIAPYLPYGLKVSYQMKNSNPPYILTMMGIGYDNNIYFDNKEIDVHVTNFSYIKPILRPLSDLFKNVEGLSSGVEISHIERMLVLLNRSVYGDESLRGIWNNIVNNVTLMTICENKIIIDYLYSNHFDVEAIFNHGKGLIEKGLAIDINTIKEVTGV